MTPSLVERRVDTERHPQIEVRKKELEVRREDTDDGERLPVDEHGLSENLSVAAKSSPPQPITENDNTVLARRFLLVTKNATESGRLLDHRKELRGHTNAADGLRGESSWMLISECEVPIPPRDDAVEATNVSPPIKELPWRRIHVERQLRWVSLDD